MTLQELNLLDKQKLNEELKKCCGSSAWVEKIVTIFPIKSKDDLFKEAEKTWFALEEKDWREAFSHHPEIGDIESIKKKFNSTASWASGEQSAVTAAAPEVLDQLAAGNKLYAKKFGYIFIVCATGRSAGEMLDMLHQRLKNLPEEELMIAAREQHKITQLRLEKLLS
jgi:2-oxo-4-hydroxy-4-carboxy-5-ureidoimidazoline decarboxylase